MNEVSIGGVTRQEVRPGCVRYWAKTTYDGRLGYYRQIPGLYLRNYVTFPRKPQAVAFAKSMGYPARFVQRVGSRFWWGWGIQRGDHYSGQFLYESGGVRAEL